MSSRLAKPPPLAIYVDYGVRSYFTFVPRGVVLIMDIAAHSS